MLEKDEIMKFIFVTVNRSFPSSSSPIRKQVFNLSQRFGLGTLCYLIRYIVTGYLV